MRQSCSTCCQLPNSKFNSVRDCVLDCYQRLMYPNEVLAAGLVGYGRCRFFSLSLYLNLFIFFFFFYLSAMKTALKYPAVL